MENTINNPNGGFTEPVKQHQPQPNGKASGAELDFPEVVDWKSSKATIYRQRHRGKFRYEVRHHDAEGLMQRATFDDYDAAKKHANALVKQMGNGGQDMLVLRGPERRAYERANQLLQSSGLDLDGLVTDSLAANKLLEDGATLRDAADYYAKHRPKALPAISVEAVVAEFIESRKLEEAGKLYLRDLRLRLGRFAKAFCCPISMVCVRDIDRYLARLKVSKRTRYNHRGTIGTLMNFAKEQEYLRPDFMAVKKVGIRKATPTGTTQPFGITTRHLLDFSQGGRVPEGLLPESKRLAEKDVVAVEAIDATTLADLFARVLINGTNHLLKRGFDRGYVSQHEWTGRLRGRICFQEAISRNATVTGRLPCDFDELSYNVLHNRILKATMRRLIRTHGLAAECSEGLTQLCRLFSDIQDIELTNRLFGQVQLHRNNQFYDFLLKVCELIYRNLLVIGWAGLLGEALVSDPELLDFESLFVCHMPFDDMSDTDREAICAQGTAPGTAWRNFEEAYRILKAHRSKVIRVVRALLGKRAILPRSQGRLRCFPITLASQAPIVMTGPTRPGRTG